MMPAGPLACLMLAVQHLSTIEAARFSNSDRNCKVT
jgi:hypothetical protein